MSSWQHGSINEVDLLVLTAKGFYLIEIKSRQWRVEAPAPAPERPVPSADRPAPAPAPHPPRKGETGDLLAHLEPSVSRPAAAWIDRLFESDLFAAQREQASSPPRRWRHAWECPNSDWGASCPPCDES